MNQVEQLDHTERRLYVQRRLTCELFNTSLGALYEQLHKTQHRCRARLLDIADVHAFLDTLGTWVDICQTCNIPLHSIRGYLDAGAVCNAYATKGSASSTTICVASGTIALRRDYARRVSGGGAGKHLMGVTRDALEKAGVDLRGWIGTGGYWRPRNL